MEEKTRRYGRKPLSEGGKSSPRKIFAVCSAVVDGNLVQESIPSDIEGSNSDYDIILNIKSKFIDKYKTTPVVSQLFFERKGIKVSKKQNDIVEEEIDISISEIVFKPEKPGKAIHNGWNVSVHRIENFDDSVFVHYKSHKHNESKERPQSKIVKISNLECYTDT